MNSKQKVVFKKIALSALMISALGSAAALANAATPTPDAKPVKPVPVTTPGALAVQLQDPLAVAKQYAPETVPAWEKLLNEYDAAIADNTASLVRVPFETSSAVPQPVADQNPAVIPVPGDFEFSGIEVQAGQAAPVEGVKIDTSKLSGVTRPAPAVPAAAGQEPAPVPAQGMISLNVATGEVKEAAPAEDSLLQRQIDLSKAVESKDTSSIKAALSNLFAAYETQIKPSQGTK
ncbi:hypothetical protein AWM70_17010 [Paenibacillus yonginensis]|uniref:Uncharacterized protein n=1 Tax=Paenibacillus yonginensis TaxID=1462996 RepID=A0A1B1N3P8_9BACL|nr:hypothetical protein [Paenibacillus yonginensis]ANS76071.1 hypothetical protein AWM70_17010 [Paenibacillus yonginensis]